MSSPIQPRNDKSGPLLPTLNQAPAGCHFPSQPPNPRAVLQQIARSPKYQHFVNIPGRIIRCLDYLGIAGDRELIKNRLQAYYLFIGVVDEAIDSEGLGIGAEVLEYLTSRDSPGDRLRKYSIVTAVTQLLKQQMDEDCRSLTGPAFRRLYQEVLAERAATSIDSYLDCRSAVGSVTAELSFLLIRPLLQNDSSALQRLMREVGTVGCLIDSLLDLGSDYRLGLLSFKPAPISYLKLLGRTVYVGSGILLRHPRLCFLFWEAMRDNIRDCATRTGACFEAGPASERNHEAASVA